MANNPQFTGMQPLRPHVVNQVGHPQVHTPQSVQLRNVAPLPPPPPAPSFTPAASNMGSSTSRIQYSNVSPTQLPPPPPRGQVMAASVQPQIPSNLTPNYGGPGNNPMSFNLSDSQQVSMGSTDQHVQTWSASGNQNVPSVLSQQQIVEQGNAEKIWYSSGNYITGQNVEQRFELPQSLRTESSQKPEGLVSVGNDNLPAENKEDSSVWKEHTRDGRTFYYNRMTKVSTWNKPFELMTPTERADSTTDWREVTAPDGRRFFYNSVLHKSKWLMPDEVKLARQLANLIPREETNTGEDVHPSVAISSASGVEAINVLVSAEPMVPNPVNSEPGSASDPPFVQEESEAKVTVTDAAASVVESETPVAVTEPCVTTSPTKISDTMSPQEAEPSSKTATGSEEEAIKSSEGSVAVGIEAQDGKKEEQGPLTYESKEDAKNAFKALLESANVGTESNWDQAMRMIINDRRYGALRSLGEKKQVFHEFVAQKKKQEAEERRVRQKKAREDFKSMLEEAGDLTSSIRWSKAISMFEKDERFQAVDRVKDREDIFEDYIEELEKKERAKASEDYKRHKAEYFEFLKSCDFIKASSQWRKVQHRLEADERCSRLEKIDRLEMFQEYVRDLEMEEEAKRKLRTAEQRKAERRNRDDFRKLMDEHVANGTLTANTHWRDYSNKVKDAPAYVAVTSNTSGSTAKELFDDVIEDLEKQYLDDKEKIEDAMKNEKICLSKSSTLEKFKAALPSKITSKAVSDINLKIIFDELLESAKEKEEKESKKRKRLTQDIYDYLINLKDIKASSKWEEFKSLVQARFVADDSFFQEIFDKVTSDLKEKTKEKERKRKEEKSKKEKERKHKEKERKSKHQKRKRRRSDDSDSDSSDSHHLSEERRSRDRDRKHHKHRASSPDKRHYSDDEHKDLSRTHRHTGTDSKRSKQAEKQSSTTEADSRRQSKRQKRDHSDGGFEKNDDHKDVQIGDEDVEDIGEKARQSKSHNPYPHHLENAGYRGKSVEWAIEDHLDKLVTISENLSPLLSSGNKRTKNFLRARPKEGDDGNYISVDATRELANEVARLHQQQQEGAFVSVRHHDALSTAIGKPDHPARVGDIEKTGAIQNVFGNPSEARGSYSRATSMDQIRAEVTAQVRAEMEEKFRRESELMKSQVMSDVRKMLLEAGYPIPPDIGPSPRPRNSDEDNGVMYPRVRLAMLVKGKMEIVAIGTIVEGRNSGVVHGVSVANDNIKVSVDIVPIGKEEVPIPVPTNDLQTVGDSHGTYVQWPRRWTFCDNRTIPLTQDSRGLRTQRKVAPEI